MSNDNINPTKPANEPTVDMSQPYAVQMVPLCERVLTHLRGGSGKFSTMHDLSGNYPEHTKQMQTYTSSELLTAVKRWITVARNGVTTDVGFVADAPKYASDLPAKPSKLGCIESLTHTYTVTRGDNKGAERVLVLNALASIRNKLRRENKRIKTSLTIMKLDDGDGAWYAEGVVDNDGNPRKYPSESKARKAFARLAHGDNWWVTDKAARLKAAVVRQGQPSSAVVYAEMSAAKAIALAKQNGAPADVTTGTGAGNRSRNWLIDNQV